MITPEILQELRDKGLSWNAIAKRLNMLPATLLCYRKTHKLPLSSQHHSNDNKKICQSCRHMFLKKDLVHHNGWLCKECYKNRGKENGRRQIFNVNYRCV